MDRKSSLMEHALFDLLQTYMILVPCNVLLNILKAFNLKFKLIKQVHIAVHLNQWHKQ